jgi:hypothetical protein
MKERIGMAYRKERFKVRIYSRTGRGYSYVDYCCDFMSGYVAEL